MTVLTTNLITRIEQDHLTLLNSESLSHFNLHDTFIAVLEKQKLPFHFQGLMNNHPQAVEVE